MSRSNKEEPTEAGQQGICDVLPHVAGVLQRPGLRLVSYVASSHRVSPSFAECAKRALRLTISPASTHSILDSGAPIKPQKACPDAIPHRKDTPMLESEMPDSRATRSAGRARLSTGVAQGAPKQKMKTRPFSSTATWRISPPSACVCSVTIPIAVCTSSQPLSFCSAVWSIVGMENRINPTVIVRISRIQFTLPVPTAKGTTLGRYGRSDAITSNDSRVDFSWYRTASSGAGSEGATRVCTSLTRASPPGRTSPEQESFNISQASALTTRSCELDCEWARAS
mmetsp:Transcript_18082/g.42591  ORF Transcript_18082/g.42591 Transcript_18082/m.42591 type:complete len:283 (-) Transcript_18082:624-1472(-)